MNPQALLDGLVAGSMIGLGAIGVTLTYSIMRFANFAHGEFISWGAYFALTAAVSFASTFGIGVEPLGPFSFGWALPIACVLSVVLTALLALVLDWLLFRPLRRRNSEMIILVIASFGASIALRSLLEFIFTNAPRYYSDSLQISMPLFAGIRATPDQLLMLGVTAVLFIGVHLVLSHSETGRQMRAVSENPALAEVAGIDVARVVRMVWIFGGGLAAAAGVMAGLVVQIRPYMGFNLLLPLFAAAILGGIGSVPGAVIGGIFVGLCEAVTVQMIGAEWRQAVAFLILAAVLVLRPNGIFGKKAP